MTPRKYGEMVANHKEKAGSKAIGVALRPALFVTIVSFRAAPILYDFFVTDYHDLVPGTGHSVQPC